MIWSCIYTILILLLWSNCSQFCSTATVTTLSNSSVHVSTGYGTHTTHAIPVAGSRTGRPLTHAEKIKGFLEVPESYSEIVPSNDTHTASVIFLHGHGQLPSCWWEDMMDAQLSYTKVVIPSSKDIPVTYHNRSVIPAWFDFYRVYHQELNETFPKFNSSTEELDEANTFIHHLINEEVKHGIKSERIVISGYGQGGALAIHSALSYPKKLGGIIVFSTWKPDQTFLNKTFNSVNKDIYIRQSHLNVSENFVTDDTANLTMAILKKIASKNIEYKIFGDHRPTHREQFDDMKEFLETHIPPL